MPFTQVTDPSRIHQVTFNLTQPSEGPHVFEAVLDADG